MLWDSNKEFKKLLVYVMNLKKWDETLFKEVSTSLKKKKGQLLFLRLPLLTQGLVVLTHSLPDLSRDTYEPTPSLCSRDTYEPTDEPTHILMFVASHS